MVDLKALSAPFSPASISWRVGAKAQNNQKGLALAYIDARDVQERLDEVCGPDGWQCKYSHANSKTVCDIGIKIGDEWIWKANGAGDTDVEQEKGALSDAFKRAAVMWGVGRYLYSFPSIWVKIRPFGKSFTIEDTEYPILIDAMAKHSAGVKVPSTLPPRDLDGDAANGHARWVSDQKAFLSTVANVEDARSWHEMNKKNIDKLGRDNIPLHGDLKKAYKDALARTQAGLQ
jgi:hypothetical protein